jgi:hypothetical protein
MRGLRLLLVSLAVFLSGCAGLAEFMVSLGESARAADNTMRAMGYTGGMSTPTPSSPPAPVGCSLRSQSASGMYRSCHYSCTSGNFTRMIGAAEMCPFN